MNILGVDTTGKLASVIVKYLDKTIYNEDINNVTHSEKLLSLIDKTLNNINLKDINLLATTIGPGSFTGVRISVSTIKAMAQALNLKIVAIPSLELMAYSYYLNNNSKYICSMLDARNDRVYYSIYEITENSNKIDIIKKCDISNDIFDNVLNKINTYNNITVICDNILPFKDRLNNIPCDTYILNTKYFCNYIENVNNVNITDYLNLDVIYARMSQAERVKNDL